MGEAAALEPAGWSDIKGGEGWLGGEEEKTRLIRVGRKGENDQRFEVEKREERREKRERRKRRVERRRRNDERNDRPAQSATAAQREDDDEDPDPRGRRPDSAGTSASPPAHLKRARRFSAHRAQPIRAADCWH
jgi:hypothetical protein